MDAVLRDLIDHAKRNELIATAREYLGTKYHVGGMVKGVGVDCASFLLCVLRDCGLIEDEELGVFSGDWWCHTSEEKYMLRVLRHAYKILEGVSWSTLQVSPGNIALAKAVGSKVYNHGGIVINWPTVIHAGSYRVEEIDASIHQLWAGHQIAIFDVVAHALNRRAEDTQTIGGILP